MLNKDDIQMLYNACACVCAHIRLTNKKQETWMLSFWYGTQERGINQKRQINSSRDGRDHRLLLSLGKRKKRRNLDERKEDEEKLPNSTSEISLYIRSSFFLLGEREKRKHIVCLNKNIFHGNKRK